MFANSPKNQTSYQILETAGEGLTSYVYKALRKHTRFGLEQVVALKVFKSKKRVQSLKSEIAVLSQVQSEHCVRMLGWDSYEGQEALILEYIDGVSLFDLLKQYSLSVNFQQEILFQIQSGLIALQEYGLFHGDLSLKNIMISQRGHVKLLDFGFTKFSDSSHGTPQYLPLECWRGEPASWQGDLFSLGLIAHDMSNGLPLEVADQSYWKERASAVSGTCSLTKESAEQRELRQIEGSPSVRKELGQLVRRVKCLDHCQPKTERLRTVLLGCAQRDRWAGVLFSIISFMSLQIHTAELVQEPKLYKLDIRKEQWAQVSVSRISSGGRFEIARKAYTPVRLGNLEAGDYLVQWGERRLRRKIRVHLSANRRIILE